MRRRDLAAEAAQAAAGEPPENLRTMRGVSDFRAQADAEPVPEWVQPGEVEQHRRYRSYALWMATRRDWCTKAGRSFAATFYPHWLERRR